LILIYPPIFSIPSSICTALLQVLWGPGFLLGFQHLPGERGVIEESKLGKRIAPSPPPGGGGGGGSKHRLGRNEAGNETHVFLMPDDLPNLSASSLICTASSRVGASTSRVGPPRGSLRVAFMCSMPGSRKPHVLPDPVLAIDTISLPWQAMGQDWAWMGVGSAYPALRICRYW